MKPTLVIIGNAEPDRNYSSLVEDAAFVMRFNRVPFYHTGMTGIKTTVQVVQNMDFHNGDLPHCGARQHWMICENPDKDFSERVAMANGIHCWSRIYSDLLDVPSILHSKGGSSGFIAITYLIRNGFHNFYDMKLIGFTWKGWPGHAWDKEKELCQWYDRQGWFEIL